MANDVSLAVWFSFSLSLSLKNLGKLFALINFRQQLEQSQQSRNSPRRRVTAIVICNRISLSPFCRHRESHIVTTTELNSKQPELIETNRTRAPTPAHRTSKSDVLRHPQMIHFRQKIDRNEIAPSLDAAAREMKILTWQPERSFCQLSVVSSEDDYQLFG